MSGPEPQSWEYRRTNALTEPELNALGAEGWELTGVDDGGLYFKRPRLSFRERVTLEQKARYYALWDANANAAEEELQ